MKPAPVTCLGALSLFIGSLLFGVDTIPSRSTYAQRYGETKTPVAVDPSRDLPRYPAVEPKNAIATWQVKKGFKLELAAHEPQVRDPIAICFDENGRMFVCEMIDYSEMRDVTPHLGRVSMLEDKDADGYFETSTVFADDLAWPTGLIWANGGLFVGATPDIWFFKDSDGDGKAEVREKVFTGFGAGLKMLNVQGLMNSFQWGLDNRIHILTGGGNRGKIKRNAGFQPVSPSDVSPETETEIEIGGKDFWFDPRTFEFGLEGGGAQYGMSFDSYGRKFGCSNSDHLQYWVYDDRYAARNPYFQMPPARQSIAVDGGAAEVFRISPDEPWRIIRTRWRIAGVVKGVVEGGGRVSGYFTGATGTTIYRGDAYGPEFVNNSFTGDAGGQLIHRKIIRLAPDGISLIGERPADERGFEFAASKDTWVRVVNFANAPDGCLYVCDMYREIIEHPWSIPDEIKQHLDLNSGNDRGRIYRIVPEELDPSYPSDSSNKTLRRHPPALTKATTAELVKTLTHPNGWHRDTAARLLCERGDQTVAAPLKTTMQSSNTLAQLHALGVLNRLGILDDTTLAAALKDQDSQVVEAAIRLADGVIAKNPSLADRLANTLAETASSRGHRLRFQALISLSRLAGQGHGGHPDAIDNAAIRTLAGALIDAAKSSEPNRRKWIGAAVASASADLIPHIAQHCLMASPEVSASLAELLSPLLQATGARNIQSEIDSLISELFRDGSIPPAAVVKALAKGLQQAGASILKADKSGKLANAIAQAIKAAENPSESATKRIEAISLLEFAGIEASLAPLTACLSKNQPEVVQAAAVRALGATKSGKATGAILKNLPALAPTAREAALQVLLANDKRAIALLEDVRGGNSLKPADFSASQVQSLVKHANPQVTALAKTVLASVIPPSREEVIAKFKPALSTKGDAKRGEAHFLARCIACHRANGQGIQIGPDLVTVKTKGREALLTAILEPHKEVAPQFIAYTVNTKDGQSLSGIVTNDDAGSMTIKLMGGAAVTFPRANIKGTSSAGQSLMPEGLGQGMDVQAMADLLDFIEAVK